MSKRAKHTGGAGHWPTLKRQLEALERVRRARAAKRRALGLPKLVAR